MFCLCLYNHSFICLLLLCMLFACSCQHMLNTFPFIQRTEQVLIELDISAIEEYVIIITRPPHISSSEKIIPRLTLAHLRTNKSPFLKSYLHKVDHIYYHYAPFVTLTNTASHQLTHIRTML